MSKEGGVILIMLGVMGLYLIWSAKSPANQGTPPTNIPGSGNGNEGSNGQSNPPIIMLPNPIPGGPPLFTPVPPGMPYPNPTDPGNPIYQWFEQQPWFNNPQFPEWPNWPVNSPYHWPGD